MTSFDRQYQKILKEIMQDGIEELSERTGHAVRSLPGKTIEIEPEDGFPLLTLRKIPIRIFVAEQIWFLTGSRKPAEFLSEFTKIWDDFTNINGVISTAYGYRWKHHFGRDQIDLLIKLLSEEPSSRHAVVVTWDPAGDGLNSKLKKPNIPCPYTFTLNIIGEKLHMHNIVRSNDMILGCPHDVGGFAFLQRLIAAKLGVGVGKYTHSISNAHIYDTHFEGAKEMIKRKKAHGKQNHKKIKLEVSAKDYDRACDGDKELVAEITEKLASQYKPMPPIKGLKIVF